jgi:multiple sugar transport system ATP-binding protein
MLSGVLQQVGSPMDLYNNPTNLFVAGFIGSPGMNFLPATIDDGVAHLPMVDVPVPQDVRERIGRRAGEKLIAGIRPEDFEDAAKVDAETRVRGTTFRTRLDLVEAMGAEYYAHFGVDAQRLRSSELQELRDDAGGVEAKSDSGDTVVVARLNPESRARSGEPADLWLDASKLHFFAESGEALTHKQ